MYMGKLHKPVRKDFEPGQGGRHDYYQAIQIWALVQELLRLGVPHQTVEALLEKHAGNFSNWDYLWSDG